MSAVLAGAGEFASTVLSAQRQIGRAAITAERAESGRGLLAATVNGLTGANTRAVRQAEEGLSTLESTLPAASPAQREVLDLVMLQAGTGIAELRNGMAVNGRPMLARASNELSQITGKQIDAVGDMFDVAADGGAAV